MSVALSKMKRVYSVDNAFMDEGEWMVWLVPGFAFYDAAEKPKDDPHGAIAAHCKGGTVRELQRRIRDADPCRCGVCVKLLAEQSPRKA